MNDESEHLDNEFYYPGPGYVNPGLARILISVL